MIKYEYINIAIPGSLIEHMATLKEYGDTGWKAVAMYNGYIFFERKIKVKIC